MICECGNDFTTICDESMRVEWCSNCGRIKEKHFAEENYCDSRKPNIIYNIEKKIDQIDAELNNFMRDKTSHKSINDSIETSLKSMIEILKYVLRKGY